MIYLVEPSDKRNILLLNKLKEKHTADEFRFGMSIADVENTLIVFSPARKLSCEEASAFPQGSRAAGGKQPDDVLQILNGRGVRYFNLIDNESYAVKNAKLTAEATLALVISSTEKSIFENNVLILGLGRVGKAVALLFEKIGIKTAAATFNKAEFDSSALYVGKVFSGKDLAEALKDYDVIINTIPEKILHGEIPGKIQPGAVLIELASVSCLEKEDTGKYLFKYIPAPGLPMKYSAINAADILFECLNSIN